MVSRIISIFFDSKTDFSISRKLTANQVNCLRSSVLHTEKRTTRQGRASFTVGVHYTHKNHRQIHFFMTCKISFAKNHVENDAQHYLTAEVIEVVSLY